MKYFPPCTNTINHVLWRNTEMGQTHSKTAIRYLQKQPLCYMVQHITTAAGVLDLMYKHNWEVLLDKTHGGVSLMYIHILELERETETETFL